MTELQHSLYLIVTDFEQKRSKRGEKYGMPVAQYAMPESIFSYEAVTAAYSEEPGVSKDRIYSRVRELYPGSSEKELKKLL